MWEAISNRNSIRYQSFRLGSMSYTDRRDVSEIGRPLMEKQGHKDSTNSVAESQANSKTSGGNTQKQETHPEENDYGHTRVSMDKILTRAIKRRFTDVLD